MDLKELIENIKKKFFKENAESTLAYLFALYRSDNNEDPFYILAKDMFNELDGIIKDYNENNNDLSLKLKDKEKYIIDNFAFNVAKFFEANIGPQITIELNNIYNKYFQDNSLETLSDLVKNYLPRYRNPEYAVDEMAHDILNEVIRNINNNLGFVPERSSTLQSALPKIKDGLNKVYENYNQEDTGKKEDIGWGELLSHVPEV